MPRARKLKTWSYICGEKGANRVRVFVHPTGKVFAEYRKAGRKTRRSLEHCDYERAKREADELAAALRQPARGEAATLGQLFDNYLRDVTPTKTRASRYHDRAAIEWFLRVFGSTTRAPDLNSRDAVRYSSERQRAGDLRLRKKPPGPLKSRTIAYDLRLLKSILTWGVGAGMLERNPLASYKVTDDGTPRRPVFTDAQYRALM